jgi:lysophospholipase L1-like esterase
MLMSVDGFRKLVHSIGISVETDNPTEQAEFIFQMYGKADLYGGGSNLTTVLLGDGAEKRIYLSDIEWTEDDYEPGQIKIILDTPEKKAKASVRFYLNDGFLAPEVLEENAIDLLSKDYKRMIENSLMSTGNIARLGQAISNAKAGKDVTIAYIGGSITQGAGATPINTECYAYKSYRLFAEKFGATDNVHFVKAGVGGTPSELGMIRFDRDVLRNGVNPDVVIIEFAVNDEGDETKGDCFESLVRKVLKLPNNPAVILLFSVFANDDNLQERLAPIGTHYELPMVSIKNAVTPQFKQKVGEGRVLSKNQFFYDMFHPSNIGHTIMADSLGNLFDEVENLMKEDEEEPIDKTKELLMLKPVIGNTFDNIKLLDKKDTYAKAEIDCGGFTEIDTVLQSVEMDMKLKPTPEFPYNWMFDGTKSDKTYFEMKICCKALVMVFKDSGETDAARAEVFVDGVKVRTADPYVNGWLHCNPIIIFKEKVAKEHMIWIQIVDGDEQKKFTILGFGYVE